MGQSLWATEDMLVLFGVLVGAIAVGAGGYVGIIGVLVGYSLVSVFQSP